MVIRRSVGPKEAASFVGSANNFLESTPRESLRMKPLEYPRAASNALVRGMKRSVSEDVKLAKNFFFAARRNRTLTLLARIEERNQLDYWSAWTDVEPHARDTNRDGSRDNQSKRLTGTYGNPPTPASAKETSTMLRLQLLTCRN